MPIQTSKKLTTLTFLLVASSSALAAGQFFCCHDSSGNQVCGDILPQACYGRAYREIGSNGQTVRTVEAPLTAEQRVLRAAEDEKHRIENEKRLEQHRKDQALLNTYGNERDIDAMRIRRNRCFSNPSAMPKQKSAKSACHAGNSRTKPSFTKKKTLPADIKKGLDDADFEIRAQNSNH